MSDFSNTYDLCDFSFETQFQNKFNHMKSRISLLVLTLFITSFSVQSQTLSELDWLAGYWTNSENGTTMEELWTPASGSMMLGLHRDVYGNGRSSFENLRIIETQGKIIYLASPGGRPATLFTLKETSVQKVVFENLENNFPQRIIYTRKGNKLTARIEDASGEKVMEWTWNKTNFDK